MHCPQKSILCKYARSQDNFAGDIKYIRGKDTNQISAPTPCWGNPSSTVTSLLVFLTEALIVSLSSGLIERKLITCINKISYLCHQTWKCYKLHGLYSPPSIGLPQHWFLPLRVSQQPVKQTTLWLTDGRGNVMPTASIMYRNLAQGIPNKWLHIRKLNTLHPVLQKEVAWDQSGMRPKTGAQENNSTMPYYNINRKVKATTSTQIHLHQLRGAEN